MNRDGHRSAKSALRGQDPSRTQQNPSKTQENPSKTENPEARSCSSRKDTESQQHGPQNEGKPAALLAERAGKGSPGAGAEFQRKLSDASNASEDLSKDSGCLSGKLSSSGSSSEISDCPSEGTKLDSPSSELSWIDGKADLNRGGQEAGDGRLCVKTAGDGGASRLDAAALLHSSGAFGDLMMGNSTEDLVREVEDLRSENEYLKDEVEELRCEMLEMRDMFQEEEVFQLQELRLQLEQANKTCRILHYRLRKAERRSIRVAQTGQVDGELVKSLEHDIKVAKSVSRRLCTELEVVQKKNSQLEWDNEALREKTQELEVCKQVLQTELEKTRESSQKKRRSTASKAEKRLSQQIEDDSADLKCQLHFAKEELALMCKKLTKLVSDSETMREDLAKYQAAYGDVDATQTPERKQSSGRSREAEVKAHLKLVEEEATLLSRRIVELEVENRGLRAEMSDLREKTGGGRGGEEEDEENRDVLDENQAATDRERGLKIGPVMCEQGQDEESDKRKADVEAVCFRSQSEVMASACHIPREGPIGGEWDPSERDDNSKSNRALKGMTEKDLEALLALRDHSCILSSALQILMTPTKNGHNSPPTSAFSSPTDLNSNGKAQKILLNEAVELLQAMLLAFISRVETLLTLEDTSKMPALQDGHGNRDTHGMKEFRLEAAADRRSKEMKQKAKETRESSADQQDFISSCRDPKMQLSLQILWILHQWCQVSRPDTEGKEDKSDVSVLRGLLRELGEELQDERIESDSEARAAPGDTAERAVSAVLSGGRPRGADRIRSSTGDGVRRQLSPHGAKRSKNWCYVSEEAAQLDREDPVKTWDHLIMPLSFPDLNFEQMSMERSHTAPEKSVFRIYYSPPSARRVQLAQQSPVSDSESVSTPSRWCTPPTSFSQLCLGSSANLSDDMKEMTAGWRQTSHGGSQEKRGRLPERWVDVSCSGTQTLTKPQMVSVGQQTDGAPGSIGLRSSPSRVLSPSLVSARSHHISSSLDGIAGRAERPRSSTSSPKLYRRHSASAVSSIPSPASLSSSSSTSRDRALWNLSHKSHSGLVLSRQSSPRAGATQNHGSLGGTKPPGKTAGANRYGLVTEFLRRVSGRTDKPAPPGPGQKTKNPKNLERVPTRPPSAPLHRNDSVTRIVNQRFMKQREEASARGPREEKGSGLNQSSRNSMSTTTTEDGNYECSSSRTLTFCFARPSRTTQRQTSNLSKLQRHRQPSTPSTAAD